MKNEKRTISRESEGAETSGWIRWNQGVAAVGALLLITGLPLVYHDYYFDVLNAKYWYYCAVVIGMMGLMLIGTVAAVIKAKKSGSESPLQAIFSSMAWRSLTIPDKAMLLLFLFTGISTFQSEYFYESFWGNEGRCMGFFLTILYTIAFFLISKNLKWKKWYLDLFLLAGMLACALGNLHFWGLDPLGFKAELLEQDWGIFISTIGNINTYTSYVALLAGVSMTLFCTEGKPARKLWYGLCAAVSMMSLITGISDNSYITFIVLFGLLPFLLFDSIGGFRNYLLLLSILCTEFLVIGKCVHTIQRRIMPISGLFDVIAGFKWLPLVVGLLWLATAALWALERYVIKGEKRSSTGRRIWLGICFAAACVLGKLLIDVNLLGRADSYGALQNYLLFDDEWGTHRGYIWRLCFRIYSEFPLLHKLFGYGPDTFGILTVNSYYKEMVSRYNEIFDSVHNEYIQLLITTGVVGMAAYVALLVSSVIRLLKQKKQETTAIAIAVSAYAAQAAVNISVPIVAPVMMTLMMMGLAYCGKGAADEKGN